MPYILPSYNIVLISIINRLLNGFTSSFDVLKMRYRQPSGLFYCLMMTERYHIYGPLTFLCSNNMMFLE